jgi:hypothetical protein
MLKSAIDEETRIKAIDLIRVAVGRLQRVHDSPQTSSDLAEADIAMVDLKAALNALNELSDSHRRHALPDLRLLVYKLDGIDEPNISEAHDDILEACLLIEDV